MITFENEVKVIQIYEISIKQFKNLYAFKLARLLDNIGFLKKYFFLIYKDKRKVRFIPITTGFFQMFTI